MEEISKQDHAIELNENTDGFITQIIHPADSVHSDNSKISSVNVHLMDASVLIPDKKSKQKPPFNHSKSFTSIDTNLTDRRTVETLPSTPPIIVPPNLSSINSNSFINREHLISFVATNDLKVLNKKAPVNKLQSFSMTGDLKPNMSQSSMDKSNFSRAFQFLPNILSDSNQFPNRKNFHHRKIFLRYLTNKIEKEQEFTTAIKSSVINTNSLGLLSKKSTGKSRKNFLIDDSGAYYEDQQIFFDLKKASSPPPSQLARYATRLKQQASNLTQSNLRCKSLNNNVDKKSTLILDDETKSVYTKPLTINTVKNVVDLNEISDSSRLSGHYFTGVVQNKNNQSKRLGDLNLNELWPSSRMYKVSIKANPWVNSFKARTFANEVNTNFRNTLDSGYSSNRLDTKRNISLLPNIKQIF